MEPDNRLVTRVLKKRSVCFSLALLLCGLAYAYWSVSGSHTVSSFAASTPVEIGNRVWLDSNRNGLQDAGEPGIKGVTVHLYNSKGQMIGSTTTDADGQYHFTVSPDTEYTIKLDNAADYTSGPLKGDQLTVANGDCNHVRDSRAVLRKNDKAISEGNYPQMAVKHLVPGKNADNYNVGFVQATGNGEQPHNLGRCKPFPPEEKPTAPSNPVATPTAGSEPVATPTVGSGPVATTTPGSEPVATTTPGSGPVATPTVGVNPIVTPTSETKSPTNGPSPNKPVPTSTAPTKFPNLPPTGSNPVSAALP